VKTSGGDFGTFGTFGTFGKYVLFGGFDKVSRDGRLHKSQFFFGK